MNVLMHYKVSDQMLQIALFPESMDYMQDIQTVQARMSQGDVKRLTVLLKEVVNILNDVYEGWDLTDTEEYWKQEVFKKGVWHKELTRGWVFVEHHNRVLRVYFTGQCLTMNLDTLEKLVKELEKVK